MSRNWTDNQRRAIAARERDVCVAAGAGSGKTGVLVERFVRIVQDSLNGVLPPERRAGVDEILVITFTEKATKEMKARIVEALMAAGLREQRRALETAYISTIHGFCSRLLQENPFEAGVDPSFRVLDATEARRRLRLAFEEVIERAYATGDAEITELVAAAQDERLFGGDGRDPLHALAVATETVLGKVRGAGWRLEEVQAFWRDGQDATAARALAPVQSLLNPILSEVQACLAALQTMRAGATGALEVLRRQLLPQREALAPLSHPVNLDQIAAALSALQEVMRLVKKAKWGRHGGAAGDLEIQEILSRLQYSAEKAKALYQWTAEREERAQRLSHQFWGLLAATWAAYHEMKHSQGALDNDDLQSEAVRLLETSPGTLRRYQRRFRYLMVDEFQDTSPLQMRLIDLLHGRIEGEKRGRGEEEKGRLHTHTSSLHPTPNHLFIVGDIQQSIYGFRDADARIFQEIEREFRSNGAGEHVTLAENFRSRPEILQLVNYLFGQIWRDAPTRFTPLQVGAEHDPKSVPSIEFIVERDPGRGVYHTLEARALAARIQQIVRRQELVITDKRHPRCGQPIGYRDIAVLLRSLTDIEKYENVFAECGVPYFVVGGGRGYYARSEVRDVMNVLTVLDTPLDDIALGAAIRSPMVGADIQTLYALTRFARRDSDKRAPLYPSIPAFLESGQIPAEEARRLRDFYETIEALRAQEDRLPVGHLLERVLEATRYDARLLVSPNGKRRLANVRKLLQMANAASTRGVADFVRRLREIEKISDREGDAPTEEEADDVVRLMTIHKAKGLEFPVVLLADMSRTLLHSEGDLFLADPRTLALGCRLGDYQTAAYRAIAQAKREAELEETTRLLYVALTRAREHLILSGSQQGRSRGLNWAEQIFPLVGVLGVPEEPETRIGPGGLLLRISPTSGLTLPDDAEAV